MASYGKSVGNLYMYLSRLSEFPYYPYYGLDDRKSMENRWENEDIQISSDISTRCYGI